MATSNPYAGTPDELYWQQGYDEGFANPKKLFAKPPDVLNDEGTAVWKEGFFVGKEDAKAPPAPAAGAGANGDSAAATSAHSTGATPTEEPADFSSGGLPTFRFDFPLNEPVATAEFDTGEALVSVALFLRDNVTITFQDPVRGMSLDRNGLRVEATKALGPITDGLRFSGLPFQPSIGATVGSEYTIVEERFTPPNILDFIGQARISFTHDSAVGPVTVVGQPGVDLRVTVVPHGPPVSAASVEEFHEAHTAVWGAVAVAAGIALIAVVLAPETGGASLTLLAFE